MTTLEICLSLGFCFESHQLLSPSTTKRKQDLKEKSTVHVEQEDSFMMANLMIHSTRVGPVTGPQEAVREHLGTNTF